MEKVAKILNLKLGEEFLATNKIDSLFILKLTDKGIEKIDSDSMFAPYGTLYDLLVGEGTINYRKEKEPNHMEEIASMFSVKLLEIFDVQTKEKNIYKMFFHKRGMAFLNPDDNNWYLCSVLYDLLLEKDKIIKRTKEFYSGSFFE